MKPERRFRTIIGTPLPVGRRILLGAIGFGLAALAYVYYQHAEHAANHDSFAPGLGQLWAGLERLTSRDERTGSVFLYDDTVSSLAIFAKGVGLAVFGSIVIGVAMGVFATVHALLSPLVTAIAKVPPVALLGVFMLLFGVTTDAAKIALIVVGVSPTLANGIVLCAKALPRNIIVKAYSLGASTPEVVVKVILPIILPTIIEMIRLSIGPAWVYLIASEGLVASEGLGYRIFLQQRHMGDPSGMSIIILYCIWLAILGVLMDYTLAGLSKFVAPWAAVRKDD